MKYDHTVKRNGVIYPADTDVPVGVASEEGKPVEESEKYNKTGIMRMNVTALKELAAELGIENAENSTGESLKTAIIEKLNL